nr:hypothetical protein BaRGS_011965 [Batillaria attramentaria]
MLCEVQPVVITELEDVPADVRETLLSQIDIDADHLTADQLKEVQDLIAQNESIFSKNEEDRLMENVLGDLHMKTCLIYLDDLIIFSRTYEEHLERLKKVFQRLSEAGLKLAAKKCHLFQERVIYVGHQVSADGIAPDPEKTEVIRNWPTPTNPEAVRRFLGFAGYYRKFVKDFSKIAAPLTALMPVPAKKQKGKRKSSHQQKPWQWGDDEEGAFQRLKTILSSPPVLGYADFSLPFKLHTDASGTGLGGVLYQHQDGVNRVIAYASRALSKSEKNYPAHKLEFLALKWAVTEKFKDYLYGSKFTVITDNNPLTYVLTTAKLDATGHRWLAALAAYDFDIKYRPGEHNVDADTLSRLPGRDEEYASGDVSSEIVHTICGAVHCPAVETHCLSDTVVDMLEESEGQDITDFTERDWRRAQDADKRGRNAQDYTTYATDLRRRLQEAYKAAANAAEHAQRRQKGYYDTKSRVFSLLDPESGSRKEKFLKQKGQRKKLSASPCSTLVTTTELVQRTGRPV